MPIAFDFKHNFHKRIDGVEFLVPEIIPRFKFQFVNPAVGLSGWKKIADSTVAVRYAFRDARPCDAVGAQPEEMDRHSPGRDSPVDIQNVRAQLILLGRYRRRRGGCECTKMAAGKAERKNNRFQHESALQCFSAAGLSASFPPMQLSCRRFRF